jgi:hypothetical protein
MDDLTSAARTELLLKDEGLAKATAGLWIGVAGMALAMMGPFTCYMSYLLALPCGIASVYTSWRAYEVLRGIQTANAERNMAVVGLVSGGLTAALSGMMAMMFALMAALYVAVLLFSLVSGSAT